MKKSDMSPKILFCITLFLFGIWYGGYLSNNYPTVKEKTLKINLSKYDKFHFEDGDPAMAWSWLDVTLDRQEFHDAVKYYQCQDIKQIINCYKNGWKARLSWTEKI